MAKIIIGIHGLANKPPRETLSEWWEKSIREGLRWETGSDAVPFDYQMVFWADLLYKKLQHDDSKFDFDNLYNRQPYSAAATKPVEYKRSLFDAVAAGALSLAGATIDTLKAEFGMNALADWVLEKTMKDLAFYYDDQRKIVTRDDRSQTKVARTVLRDELKRELRQHGDKEIMLIAHSMGSIIAYDVLRDLGQENPDFPVAEFVTIGSPLGLPHVRAKIIEERGYDDEDRRVRTPSVVRGSWTNFADRKDPVALDVRLRGDYGANGHGVEVVDDLVANDYVSPAGDANPHKSYGYLRTPELARRIAAFIG